MLVDKYNVFAISAHGPMNLSKEIKGTKYSFIEFVGREGESRLIPRTNSITIVGSLHLFSHEKMDHVLITEYLKELLLGRYFKKVNLKPIKSRIETY